MMERKISINYIEPELEIVVFQTDDVICSSDDPTRDPIVLPEDELTA